MEMLWTDFLNSHWHDWRGTGQSEDRLEKLDWLARFLETWHLSAPIPPKPADAAALRELRLLLQGLVKSMVAGNAPSPGDLDELNRVMAGGPVARKFVSEGETRRVDLLPVRQDWPQAMAEIAGAFAQVLAEGERERLRICENPDCLWVFYDDTRNRTKRFCDDKLCGNLIKVRRFRARKKAAAEEAGPQ